MTLILALLLAGPAFGGETYEHRVGPLSSTVVERDVYEDWLEEAVGLAPAGTDRVRVITRVPDGTWVDVEGLVPHWPRPPEKDLPALDRPASQAPADHPGAATGFLNDRAVYLSQCHGYKYFETLGRFSTQRGNLFDTVEDRHNPEGANAYLTAYLENAGAAVFTTRERDMTDQMVVADNDGSGYAESGSGWTTGPAGFADLSPWLNGEDPFNAGTTRRVAADSGAVATWTPDVPEDGMWAVYVSWDSDPAGAPDAHYRITHPGGVIHRYFDHTRHGSTWQYVERLWLPGGAGGLTVELVADSSAGTFVTADAVRVGGGFSDVQRVGDYSGRPRWEEAANLYVQWNGAPTSVYDPGGTGNGSDVGARSRWAAWEHPSTEDAVYFSWHSNGGGGTGTVTLYYDGTWGGPTTGSIDFAQLVQDEVVDSIVANWDAGWNDRGIYGGGFGELSPAYNNEMPAALLELAFHDHASDVEYLKEPLFRRDASRAVYRAIVRYFAERDGITPVYLPEPPTAFGVMHDGGDLVASWSAPPTGAPSGDAATGYRVFTSIDGRAWDNGVDVSGTSYTLPVADGELVFVRVAATNDGGISFPTEVLGARRASGGDVPVLIVDAYERLQSSQLLWEDVGPVGVLRRMDLARMNGYDTTVAHAAAIDALGWPFDSAAQDRVDSLSLGDWDAVLWAAGEESTTDESFSSAQQTQIESFVNAGGGLWASGSEILWDLDAQGTAADAAFAAGVLGATMLSDDAGTSAVDGVGLLAGLVLDFDPADADWDVEYPDALDTTRAVIATYDGGAPAAILEDGVALFGMPFEVIADESTRFEVMARVLPELVPGFVPGGDDDDAADDDAVDDDDAVNDDDAANDDDASPGGREGPAPLQAVRHKEALGGDAGDGCGCGVGGGGGGFVLLVLAGAVRRRRSAAPGSP